MIIFYGHLLLVIYVNIHRVGTSALGGETVGLAKVLVSLILESPRFIHGEYVNQ